MEDLKVNVAESQEAQTQQVQEAPVQEEAKAEATPNILIDGEISESIRQQIQSKIASIKAEKKLKKVYAVVVYGDDDDAKEVYIGYFRRPDIGSYSRFMIRVQEDQIQASLSLAQACFIEGDRELVNDTDMFSFGTMNQLGAIIKSRGAELVKLPSVGK